jgi:hypothetical protein
MSGFFTVTDHTDAIIEGMRKGFASVCKATAVEITKEYAATAPRDTGFMASSGYVVTHDESTYGQGLRGSGPMLPEIPKAVEEAEAWAAVAADYAAYPEYGTRYQHAQPAFYPAFDKARGHFEKECEKLEKLVSDAAGVK